MRARGRFLQVTTAVTATMMLLTSPFGGCGGGQGSGGGIASVGIRG